jgi:hypothetical protein
MPGDDAAAYAELAKFRGGKGGKPGPCPKGKTWDHATKSMVPVKSGTAAPEAKATKTAGTPAAVHPTKAALDKATAVHATATQALAKAKSELAAAKAAHQAHLASTGKVKVDDGSISPQHQAAADKLGKMSRDETDKLQASIRLGKAGSSASKLTGDPVAARKRLTDEVAKVGAASSHADLKKIAKGMGIHSNFPTKGKTLEAIQRKTTNGVDGYARSYS